MHADIPGSDVRRALQSISNGMWACMGLQAHLPHLDARGDLQVMHLKRAGGEAAEPASFSESPGRTSSHFVGAAAHYHERIPFCQTPNTGASTHI